MAMRTVVSIEVRFFLRRPMLSAEPDKLLQYKLLVLNVLSASSSHLASNGFNLHIFLKDRFKASNLEIVV